MELIVDHLSRYISMSLEDINYKDRNSYRNLSISHTIWRKDELK